MDSSPVSPASLDGLETPSLTEEHPTIRQVLWDPLLDQVLFDPLLDQVLEGPSAGPAGLMKGPLVGLIGPDCRVEPADRVTPERQLVAVYYLFDSHLATVLETLEALRDKCERPALRAAEERSHDLLLLGGVTTSSSEERSHNLLL
ncbi:unnamed protein product [Arctogadus glacialis]